MTNLKFIDIRKKQKISEPIPPFNETFPFKISYSVCGSFCEIHKSIIQVINTDKHINLIP